MYKNQYQIIKETQTKQQVNVHEPLQNIKKR